MKNNKTIESNTRSGCTYDEQYINSAHNLFNIQNYNTTSVEWKFWDKALECAMAHYLARQQNIPTFEDKWFP